MAYLCIDMGATKTLTMFVEENFDILMKIDTLRFIEDVERYIQTGTEERIEKIEKVTAAVPGPLDEEKGMIYPPNLPVDEVDIGSKLGALFDRVEMMNDCIAGVIGEYVYGEHSSENMVYLTISTGIGGGVIEDGRVLRGWRGNFAEIGHVKVGESLECRCGGTGHWEAYCGGVNLPRMAEDLTGEVFEGPEDIFRDYREGEKKAEKVVEEIRRYNATGIATVTNAYDPEIVVIGGGIAVNHPDLIVEGLEEMIERDAINQVPEIELASLKERSVIEGCRAVCQGEFQLD